VGANLGDTGQCGISTTPPDDVSPLSLEDSEVGAISSCPSNFDGPSQVTTFLANRAVLEILNGIAERAR
jgi:hypothetical protein